MTSATPADAAMALRAEMRERLHNALEAMVKRLAPDLTGLDPAALAAILSIELVRIVEGVQDEGLRRLAEYSL